MLRVVVRGAGAPTVVLGSGDTLLIGRSPTPEGDADTQLRYTTLALPDCAPHVSRLVGELAVTNELARMRWRGEGGAQLSSLFDAPGGARRVTLSAGMSALMDEGESQLLLLRGRVCDTGFTDLPLMIDVRPVDPIRITPQPPAPVEQDPTSRAPGLAKGEREWFVALALAEPWLAGDDDYPRPPSNREIYERILGWHGYAWNLERSQRVDEAIRSVATIAFGEPDDPFRAPRVKRLQNVRFAVGKRIAEVGLVTAADLDEVHRRSG
ncbi:hypothetical protein [Alloactinosynnema sp. L-07]|uniref:hypothetical protein n=1 Tax=Alloactinosynnema sp. L-07 TaxID=1653480 RepID=UPI00065F037B|nr:hypothetical protein [Alloactinosynnema sp. L-07]CRK60537.1 hypothetical protein [Alloactinosynnema sp. L-07]